MFLSATIDYSIISSIELDNYNSWYLWIIFSRILCIYCSRGGNLSRRKNGKW